MLDFPNPYNGLPSLEPRHRFSGYIAKVAELVDAPDLGSCGVTRESSSLSFRTKNYINQAVMLTKSLFVLSH